MRATQFRQWATRVLRDFAVQGYVIDRQRMLQERAVKICLMVSYRVSRRASILSNL